MMNNVLTDDDYWGVICCILICLLWHWYDYPPGSYFDTFTTKVITKQAETMTLWYLSWNSWITSQLSVLSFTDLVDWFDIRLLIVMITSLIKLSNDCWLVKMWSSVLWVCWVLVPGHHTPDHCAGALEHWGWHCLVSPGRHSTVYIICYVVYTHKSTTETNKLFLPFLIFQSPEIVHLCDSIVTWRWYLY